MDRKTAIERLMAHREELEAMGIRRLSLFGSVARGDENSTSDVDLAAEINRSDFRISLGEFVRIEHYLEDILHTRVDLLSEPVTRNPMIQSKIDRDRVRVF